MNVELSLKDTYTINESNRLNNLNKRGTHHVVTCISGEL